VAFCSVKDGLLQAKTRPFGKRLPQGRAGMDVHTNVKLSFFDKYLLKKFGASGYCPYLCISKNDK
jgi:hypothetical protein